MKVIRIFTLIFFLLLSYSAYSQIADGVYVIHHFGHSNDKQESTKYSVDAPDGSNIIFLESYIFLTIGNYKVDIIKYDDKETDYKNEMAKVKAFSYFDNIEKSVFIQTLEKGMYSLWLERGNGSADIFLFTTPEYEAPK